ncbi:hypothetical protein HZ326_27197 [Fusarium oxysporum f. sp. albedinis]|nr:hypothetical protein HZ326_27197 [Fusarium oxysporum f. sp. albedinis]
MFMMSSAWFRIQVHDGSPILSCIHPRGAAASYRIPRKFCYVALCTVSQHVLGYCSCFSTPQPSLYF